ncbi:unnamed protein product [Prorocentrum cordatum]|uniref:Centrosomal protein POC5 n=1 Tax=Prorocentrum cordatum TaxID=2364126 RepID=A0ABN9XLD9_9DINO|nr:unnamed protein product [Polarella glacialis]
MILQAAAPSMSAPPQYGGVRPVRGVSGTFTGPCSRDTTVLVNPRLPSSSCAVPGPPQRCARPSGFASGHTPAAATREDLWAPGSLRQLPAGISTGHCVSPRVTPRTLRLSGPHAGAAPQDVPAAAASGCSLLSPWPHSAAGVPAACGSAAPGVPFAGCGSGMFPPASPRASSPPSVRPPGPSVVVGAAPPQRQPAPHRGFALAPPQRQTVGSSRTAFAAPAATYSRRGQRPTLVQGSRASVGSSLNVPALRQRSASPVRQRLPGDAPLHVRPCLSARERHGGDAAGAPAAAAPAPVMPRWAGSPPGGEPAAAPAALTPRELSAGAATAGAAAAALTPREKRTSVRVSAEGWEAASRSPSPVTRAGSSPRRAGKAGSSPPPLSVCLRKVPTPSRRATRGPRDAVRGPRDAAKTGESKAAPLPEDACEARAPLPPGVREAVDGSVQAAVRHLQRDLSALSGEFKDMCSAEWKKVMEEQWAAAWSQLEDTMRNHGASGASAGDVADLVLRSPCDGADAPPRKSPSIAPAPMSGTPLGSAAFHTPLGGVPGRAAAVASQSSASAASGGGGGDIGGRDVQDLAIRVQHGRGSLESLSLAESEPRESNELFLYK